MNVVEVGGDKDVNESMKIMCIYFIVVGDYDGWMFIGDMIFVVEFYCFG